MVNFELKIVETSEYDVILAESSFGEAVAYLAKGFLSRMVDESNKLRQMYEEHIRKRDVNFRKQIEKQTQRLGSELFEGVFHEEVLSLFSYSVGGATDGQVNLRLMLGSPELSTIHWEVMRFRNEYISFRHNLVRHPFSTRPVKIPEEVSRRLNILVVSVLDRGNPLEDLVAKGHRELCTLLQGFGEQIKLVSLEKEEATLDNIKDALFKGVDIFHFTGHGHFNVTNPNDSCLLAWNEERLSIRFLNILSMHGGLGFSFLNSCGSGQVGSSTKSRASKTKDTIEKNEEMVGIAHSLIEIGVPIVVATNHGLSIQAAVTMSKRFYDSIIKYGKRIDHALRDARVELYINADDKLMSTDWSCPALYVRSKYFGLGTESLFWEYTPSIYTIRNVAMMDQRL